jgi:hypothetical protein
VSRSGDRLDLSRVFSGASIVIRASMWSHAKRSISDSSPRSASGASSAQAKSIGHTE